MADVDGQASYPNVESALRALDSMEEARNEKKAAAKPESTQPEGDEDIQDAAEYVDEQEAEQETPDEPSEDDEGEQDDTPIGAIKFAGQEYQVPEGTPPELARAVEKLGQNLEADYTRQTQVIAETRKAAEYTIRKNVEHATQMQGEAQIVMKFLGDMIGQEPDQNLIHTDPQEYLMRKEIRAKNIAQYNDLKNYVTALQSQTEEANSQEVQLMIQAEAPKLVKAMPELATEKGYKAFQAKAFDVGNKYGFSKQEIANMTDSRMVIALRDLAEFQKYKAAKGTLESKNIPPRQLKPTAAPITGKHAKGKQATREFMKSARTDRDLRAWAERTS